jgi:hypothetical protein
MTFEIRRSGFLFMLGVAVCAAPAIWGQGTLEDYQRAQGLQARARNLVVNAPGPVSWIGESDHFWYSRSVNGGTEFVLVDAEARSKRLAFDHDKLATAISSATGHTYKALALPFAPSPAGRGGGGRGGAAPTTAPLTFVDGEKSIEFGTDGSRYKCSLDKYE